MLLSSLGEGLRCVLSVGFLTVSLKGFATALFVMVLVGLTIIFVLWMFMQRLGEAELKKRREAERAYVQSLSHKLDSTVSTIKRQQTAATLAPKS